MQGITQVGQGDRRRDPRYQADIPCQLLWDDGEEPAVIRDLSRHGVQIGGHYMPPVGTRVTIVADWLEVIGTVEWVGLDRAGLLLAHEIDPVACLAHPARQERGLFAMH